MNAQNITLLKEEEGDLFYIGLLNIHQAKKRERRERLRKALWPGG